MQGRDRRQSLKFVQGPVRQAEFTPFCMGDGLPKAGGLNRRGKPPSPIKPIQDRFDASAQPCLYAIIDHINRLAAHRRVNCYHRSATMGNNAAKLAWFQGRLSAQDPNG